MENPIATQADEMSTAMYGNPEPEQQLEEVKEEPVQEPAQEPVQEAVEEPVEEVKTEEVVAEGDVEEVEVTSLEQLSDLYELEPEWLRGLKVTEKVNGEPVEVVLGDALQTHRQVKAGDTYLADAKQKAKGIIEEANHTKDTFSGSVATFASMVQSFEDELTQDEKNINWQDLREQDPAEYAARIADQKGRRERLDNLKREGLEKYQATLANIQQAEQQRRIEELPKQMDAFLERVPDWQDDSKAEKERSEVVEYLKQDGFGDQDIEVAAYNGRILALAVKAKRYDEMKAKMPAAKKKVLKIPKVMKPGPKEEAKPKANLLDPVEAMYGKS